MGAGKYRPRLWCERCRGDRGQHGVPVARGIEHIDRRVVATWGDGLEWRSPRHDHATRSAHKLHVIGRDRGVLRGGRGDAGRLKNDDRSSSETEHWGPTDGTKYNAAAGHSRL